MRPVVAITCDRRPAGPAVARPGVTRPARAEVFLAEALVEQVRAAGGVPVVLPPGDAAGAAAVLHRIDALVVAGGAFDIHPSHYGQAVAARLDRVDEGRTSLELALVQGAVARDLPLLGVCGGMQALAVALGGTLHQHVDGHEQPTDPATPWHALVPDGAAPAWLPREVNSTHHQAVDAPGPLGVLARAPDGVIEALGLHGARFCVGVQWHPELLDAGVVGALVAAAQPGMSSARE